MTFVPVNVSGNQTGLVQSRQNFLLPNDAYPTLENAFVWRERIKRKQGAQLLGRLRRILTGQVSTSNISAGGAGIFTFNIFTVYAFPSGEPNHELERGDSTTITITIAAPIAQTLTDSTGTGTMTIAPAGLITAATINYVTGDLTLTFSGAAGASGSTFTGAYYPALPVMGVRSRELTGINAEQTIVFDQKYAYRFSNGWQEFLPGTTWNASGAGVTGTDFFWSTNYWVDKDNNKIFWANNGVGSSDPIRYTNGAVLGSWYDFAPVINAAGDVLVRCKAMIPFRGRMVVFNTIEGPAAGPIAYPQRIRWAEIGNPFDQASAIVTTVVADAWKDDIRGKGGFLDIPTAQDIVAVGFVRDNLVIYCESSTWQLKYTGRSIAPFQIEKVNSELGVESTFSAVQFDTSLVGIGDKGIVECDSYKSDRIDIKIPDLVFDFNNNESGPQRVQGIRDFEQRLAFWTYPLQNTGAIFPNRRLVYNYENDSWAIFTDSITALGPIQLSVSRTWATSHFTWAQANFAWRSKPALFPSIAAGNQQGFVMLLDEYTTNQASLSITAISGNSPNVTTVTSPNNNLEDGMIIKIVNIPTGTGYASLNNQVFKVSKSTTQANSFALYQYDSVTKAFTAPQVNASATYIGGGQIQIRDNFNITSKKFNNMDQGKQFHLGWVDILMDNTESGAITMKVFSDYNEQPSNIPPQNQYNDTFFNTVVPTYPQGDAVAGGSKNWQRIYCSTNNNFVTIQYTLSDEQMNGIEQESDVQIDAQVIWGRPGGRLGLVR